MKNSFLLFIVFSSYCLLSQPVITNAIHAPKTGQSINYVSLQLEDEEYFDVDPGSGGVNKTWNFSTLKNGTPTTFSYVDPNVLKLKDAVKNLDVNILNKINDAQGNLYTLLKVSGSELLSRGITDDTFIVQAMPSPILMKFPFRYGDKFETKSGLRFGDSIEFLSTKSIIQTEADAYGSIVTADRKYDQVLRVKNYSIDSVNISFGEGFKFNFVDTVINYQWFAADKGGAVFQLNTLFVEGKLKGDGYSYLKSGTTNTDIVDDLSTTVFPNPFIDKINAQTTAAVKDVQLNVFNADGKLISKHGLDEINASGIDLSYLAEGVYFLQISSAAKILKTVRVVKK